MKFTQPEALRRLANFTNIDLRIATSGNAHAKGYIFKNERHYNLIVGSSNLTAQALSTNKEWNVKVSALVESGLVEKVLKEFKFDFEKGIEVTDEYILAYEEIHKKQFLLNRTNNLENFIEPLASITPNSMQVEALEYFMDLRTENKSRALVISATGTGKTFLSEKEGKHLNFHHMLKKANPDQTAL